MEKRFAINIVSILLLVMILLGLIVHNTTNKNDFKYHVNEDGKTITLDKYLGEDKEVIIPDSIDGKDVTVIGLCCFEENEIIVTVLIPPTVQKIGSYAFHLCGNLECINGGENICYVGDSAFSMCNKLSFIPNLEKLDIINNGVFSGCNKLSNVELSNSLSYIGRCAFSDTNIDYDIVSDSVEIIGGSAFFETPKIKESHEYVIVGDSILIEYPDIESVEIPYGVKFATGNNIKSNVKEMYLPNTVKCIDSDILYDVEKAIVYIPESVVQIGDFSSNTFKEEKMINIRYICGIAGSYAQEYANRVGICFVEVEPWY